MQRRPARYRQTGAQPSKLSVALLLSILLHIALFVVPLTLVYLLRRDPPKVFQVQLVQGAETGAERPDQAAPNPTQGPPPTEKPKGTPDAVPDPEKKPEKKPEPKKPEPEKKPEPPKPEPEKKPEPKKPEPEKKPEPKKEPEKKPEPKKEPEKKKEPDPKKEPEKKKEPDKKKEPEKKKEPDKKKEADPKKDPAKKKESDKKPVVLDDANDSPADEEMEKLDSVETVEPVDTGPVGIEDGMEGLEEIHVAKNVGELTQGSAVEAADFPSALSYWATMVKRKVDKAWHGKVPPGLSLDAAELKVRVGFWVSRSGEVIDEPVVVDGAADPALRESCIQAIKEVLPFPPFPDGFTEAEQYVTYVFTLTR